MSTRNLSARACALSLLLAAALPAGAQSTGLDAHARSSIIYFNPDPLGPTQRLQNAHSIDYTGPTFAPQTAAGNVAVGGATASGQSSAYFGTLGAYAAVTVVNPGGLDPTGTRQSVADGWSTWTDAVTITKLGAPTGTPIDIRVDLVIHVADVSVARSDWAITVAQVSFTTHGAVWCLSQASPNSYGCGADTLPLTVGRNDISFVRHTFTGVQGFAATLTASTVVESYSNTVAFSSSALADAMNTAHSYYSVLSPDTTLQSASGHVYAPVPEPAAWASLLVGLGFFGLRLRRRSSH